MKIKIVLADQDSNYLRHFTYCVQMNYFEQMELSTFSTQENLDSYLQTEGCDVILYTSDFQLSDSQGIHFLLTEEKDSSENGVLKLCKYQRMEKIYKKILSAYAESKDSYKLRSLNDKEGTNVISFISGAGGAGKSLCAVTYCRIQAMSGKRVLYLSTETFSSTAEYFSAEGDVTLSQVFFAIKRAKGNIPMKIESALHIDQHGIAFFIDEENPIEILDITKEDWEDLLAQLIAMRKFDVIVIDIESPLSIQMEGIISISDLLVMITSLSSVDHRKCVSLIRGMKIRGDQCKEDWLDKTLVLVNRAAKQTIPGEIAGIPIVGVVLTAPPALAGEQMIRNLLENRCVDGLKCLNR